MKTKAIAWSYPSSTNAVRFGFAKTGCWTVETIEMESHQQPPVAMAGFKDHSQAMNHATKMPEAWNPEFLRTNIHFN